MTKKVKKMGEYSAKEVIEKCSQTTFVMNVFSLDEKGSQVEITSDFLNWIRECKQVTALDKLRYRDSYFDFLKNFKEKYTGPAALYRNCSKVFLEGESLNNNELSQMVEALLSLSKQFPTYLFKLSEKSYNTGSYSGYSSSSSSANTFFFLNGRGQHDRIRIVQPSYDPKWSSFFQSDKKEAPIMTISVNPPAPTPPLPMPAEKKVGTTIVTPFNPLE